MKCTVHDFLQYDFPKQEAVIQFVIDAIQAEAFNPKTLFLIGSYTIGKVHHSFLLSLPALPPLLSIDLHSRLTHWSKSFQDSG